MEIKKSNMGIIQMRLIWPPLCNSSSGELNSSPQLSAPACINYLFEWEGRQHKHLRETVHSETRLGGGPFLIKGVYQLDGDKRCGASTSVHL